MDPSKLPRFVTRFMRDSIDGNLMIKSQSLPPAGDDSAPASLSVQDSTRQGDAAPSHENSHGCATARTLDSSSLVGADVLRRILNAAMAEP